MQEICSHDEVLSFWFEELNEAQWWSKDHLLDRLISDRFLPTWKGACVDRCRAWRESVEGRLAEVIVLDQFSRNIFRDTRRSFENDALALSIAEEALEDGADLSLTSLQVPFLYMPFMHSESKAAHEKAVQLRRLRTGW